VTLIHCLAKEAYFCSGLESRGERFFRRKAQYIGWAVRAGQNLGTAPLERAKTTDVPLPIPLSRKQVSWHHVVLNLLDRSQCYSRGLWMGL